MLPSCDSPTSTGPREFLEHMKSWEYSSEKHTAGNEQVGDGFREPKNGDHGGGVVLCALLVCSCVFALFSLFMLMCISFSI